MKPTFRHPAIVLVDTPVGVQCDFLTIASTFMTSCVRQTWGSYSRAED